MYNYEGRQLNKTNDDYIEQRKAYSNYEQGKRKPRKFIAFAICKYYGKPMSVLFPGEPLSSFKVGRMKGGADDVE